MPHNCEERELLGTRVRIFGDVDFEKAFKECKRIEKAFSRFLEGNELWELNQNVGVFFEVSEEMMHLLKLAQQVKENTGGAFNVAVESVLRGLGYDKNYSFVESDSGKIGEIEFDGSRVKITAPVDLGGLGKGYALKKMVECLNGSFCVDAGGDIYAQGSGWKAAFEHPLNEGEVIGGVEVDGFYLASSSASKRKWGKSHHLINTASGECADDMLAVYIQGGDGTLVDAYSTALYVMGFERGVEMISTLPVEAMLISKEGAIFRSKGFKGELFTA